MGESVGGGAAVGGGAVGAEVGGGGSVGGGGGCVGGCVAGGEVGCGVLVGLGPEPPPSGLSVGVRRNKVGKMRRVAVLVGVLVRVGLGSGVGVLGFVAAVPRPDNSVIIGVQFRSQGLAV